VFSSLTSHYRYTIGHWYSAAPQLQYIQSQRQLALFLLPAMQRDIDAALDLPLQYSRASEIATTEAEQQPVPQQTQIPRIKRKPASQHMSQTGGRSTRQRFCVRGYEPIGSHSNS